MDFSLGGLIKGNSDLGKKWFLNENYITPSGNFLLIYLFLITKTSLFEEIEMLGAFLISNFSRSDAPASKR